MNALNSVSKNSGAKQRDLPDMFYRWMILRAV